MEAKIIWDLPDSGPVIHLDRSHLDEIINAIVTNAWESLDKAGEVRVSVYTASAFDISGTHRFPLDWEPDSEKYACLRVADTGCGMDETTICRIFDPFYTDKFTGRGLGLPVILGIIKYTKGCVTVESRPGQGSVFQVFLPISMH
ncbi:MAG: ATP-binding protein [Desulfobacteraceae bacterium]